MHQIDFMWLIEYLLTIGIGFFLIKGFFIITIQETKNKSGSLGYQLHTKRISFMKAYFAVFIGMIPYCIVLSLFLAITIGQMNKHILEAFILSLILTITPTSVAIKKVLIELEREAENDSKD